MTPLRAIRILPRRDMRGFPDVVHQARRFRESGSQRLGVVCCDRGRHISLIVTDQSADAKKKGGESWAPTRRRAENTRFTQCTEDFPDFQSILSLSSLNSASSVASEILPRLPCRRNIELCEPFTGTNPIGRSARRSRSGPAEIAAMTLETPRPVLQTIGSYDLLEKIAEGGMGAIYKDRHKKTGRVVAIKVMPPITA